MSVYAGECDWIGLFIHVKLRTPNAPAHKPIRGRCSRRLFAYSFAIFYKNSCNPHQFQLYCGLPTFTTVNFSILALEKPCIGCFGVFFALASKSGMLVGKTQTVQRCLKPGLRVTGDFKAHFVAKWPRGMPPVKYTILDVLFVLYYFLFSVL